MFKRKKKKKTNNDIVFTHNCAARLACGRLESTPSMMALGSTLGTTIDGSHKGAGITKMQGQISRVQYYFEQQSWINDTYFKQRGLNKLGYLDGQEDAELSDDIVLQGSIDLDNTNSKTVIEIDDQRAEIDNRKDQNFTEI